jgi:uncharacterized protein
MHPSRYLKTFPFEEKPGHLLVFSTKKSSKILLKKETFQAIIDGTLSPADEALLLKLGMIVPDPDKEKEDVLGCIDALNKKNTALNITAVLNLDCNFGCIYCYEGDLKGDLYMSDETAESLVDFVKAKFTPDKETLLVDFYGGEPLLSIGLIRSISRKLKSFAEKRGAAFSFSLTTNGSLFTRKTAEELVELGLEAVSITLDGPAEIHDRFRPFQSGAGSFDIIIKNIKETCDLVRVGLGGNFGPDTWEKFPLLFDDLEKNGLTPDTIAGVKFDPIMKNPEGDLSNVSYKRGCISSTEPWVPGAFAMLREEILKRGYATPPMMPIRCKIEDRDSYVVNYNGVIYKCPAFMGKEGFAVGDLQTGVTDYSETYKLNIWKNQECAECAYLPLCFGGCRYVTYLKDGNIETPDCQKSYLDASLETLIKQDIKYNLKADTR